MWFRSKTGSFKTSSEGVSFDIAKWDTHGILVLHSCTVANHWKCQNSLVNLCTEWHPMHSI